jgi:hypothetical protein
MIKFGVVEVGMMVQNQEQTYPERAGPDYDNCQNARVTYVNICLATACLTLSIRSRYQ